jgi:hypothetical protein
MYNVLVVNKKKGTKIMKKILLTIGTVAQMICGEGFAMNKHHAESSAKDDLGTHLRRHAQPQHHTQRRHTRKTAKLGKDMSAAVCNGSQEDDAASLEQDLFSAVCNDRQKNDAASLGEDLSATLSDTSSTVGLSDTSSTIGDETDLFGDDDGFFIPDHALRFVPKTH